MARCQQQVKQDLHQSKMTLISHGETMHIDYAEIRIRKKWKLIKTKGGKTPNSPQCTDMYKVVVNCHTTLPAQSRLTTYTSHHSQHSFQHGKVLALVYPQPDFDSNQKVKPDLLSFQNTLRRLKAETRFSNTSHSCG